MSFTHLHLASGYSFKYGTTLPHALVERAHEYGMSSLALTDRNGLAGAIRFAQSCSEYAITPILGVDLCYENNSRITVLSGSDSWSSLVRLVTAINTYDSKNPTLTKELLEKFSIYSKNLFALHGPNSQIGSALLRRGNDNAMVIYNATRELFAGQGIECVSHLVAGNGLYSTPHAARMLGFARDYDLPAVLTNAVRMLDRKDAPVADILDASRNLAPLHKNTVERKNAEGFLKNSEEMFHLAEVIARAAGERNGKELLATTAQWAQQCAITENESSDNPFGIGSIHLPEPDSVGAANKSELVFQFHERSMAGLNWRYGSSPLFHKARLRLEDEIATIRTLGYESYFLTVADIADTARRAGIRVAARGSGAGSLICHVLGISGVEPISLNLLMERFCSPLRKALPDIDIDVESARRLEIYDQIFSRYGDSDWSKTYNASRCATVAMVDTYRARHAIRDTGAALGIPPMEIDLIAKAMPHIRARNISHALENLPELKNLNLNTPLLRMAIGLAQRLDGLPRNLAMHPCAIVLANSSFLNRVPIEINASRYPMVQFDKDDVEAIGLLKLDVLGVRMQSTLAYSLSEIERVENKKIDIDAITLDDPQTFALIQSTRTLGIFQIESPGQRELIGKFAPETFTDLIIDISLFRPGPVKSDMITPFLNARGGWKPREIFHDDLYDILRETEGVVVFHEQVIRIIATLTGCTLAEGDEKRRCLGSKEGQQEVCDWFYPAAVARGYAIKVIAEIWEVLCAFASFGFCKAHAAAFALPTYQSAWLKTHYPAHFLAGVLTHEPGMYPKRLIIDEVRQMGIQIAPIDVNFSEKHYIVEKNATGYGIRIALTDISGISQREVDAIISARPYCDLADFVKRSGASRPISEALVFVGAFDLLHKNSNHRDLFLHLRDLYKWSRTLSGSVSKNSGPQLTLSFTPELLPTGLPALKPSEKVAHELRHLGMDISHHVIEFYAEFLNSIGAVRSSDLLKHRSRSSVLVAGVKVALQTPPIRSGKRVIFLTLNDGYGCSDITFFEDIQESSAEILYNSSLFLIRGVIRKTGPRGISLRGTGLWQLSPQLIASHKVHLLNENAVI